MSSVTLVTTPSAPRLTTAPRNVSPSFSRESVRTSPSAVTSSRAETAVARFPFLTPEPCVAVAQAPAMEMWGREARLCSAKPFSWR